MIQLGGGLLVAIPLVVGGYFISKAALKNGQESLEYSAQQSLIAVRDITAGQITEYIETIKQQTLSMSESPMVVQATVEFSEAFNAYSSDTQIDMRRTSLEAYYESEFGRVFKQNNANATLNPRSLLQGISENGIALQYDYISNNDNALGNKHLLDRAYVDNQYGDFHETYHSFFRSFIDRFGYYDLFIVDANNGNIVYSVFKELDFATSLITGPYAESGIGQAFKMAKASSTSESTFITDFAEYIPSYNAPASFISSPIFQQGKMVGVLILQMPVDNINAVMTYEGKWQESGLGASGETYLVGGDYTMRSNGRFLLENKADYLSLMQEVGIDPDTISKIDSKGTSIGLQPVKTEGSQAALSGQEGFSIFEDYRNVEVLSAYKPLDIKGLNWAILSEIDSEEALLPVETLRTSIFTTTLIVLFIALAAGLIPAYLMSNRVVGPIQKIRDLLQDMVEGEGDLTKRMQACVNV